MKKILQNYRSWIMESIFLGAILSAILFGIIGYLVGLERFNIYHTGDIRAGEVATFHAIIGVFLGCGSGLFLGPLTVYLASRVYMRSQGKNDKT
ncbi:MAG TPA: hypothetical protein VIO36_06630 [Anaerolineaceae bacterium]